LNRRTVLAAGSLAAGSVACSSSAERVDLLVSLPQRSLDYAPLTVAAKAGLFSEPPLKVALLQRADGRRVAAAVVDGSVDAGAMALPDLVAAVAAGAPLVAIGALTRRFAGQLVLARAAPVSERTLAGMVAGHWRAIRVGLEIGAEGTEGVMRHILLQSTPGGPGESPSPATASAESAKAPAAGQSALSPGSSPLQLAWDPLGREPQWIGYGTGAALVAALKDGRIAAFLGRSLATAQATATRDSEVVANLSSGALAGDVTLALCQVLVARKDRVDSAEGTATEHLGSLVAGCARAAQALAGPAGAEAILRAMPDRDASHLLLAMRLDHPSPAESAYALDARVPRRAFERYLELCAQAGRPSALDPAQLETQRFVVA
jgi:ABC-type nitrate/sulfonate/bicarbonate transport system substrate-binding protein